MTMTVRGLLDRPRLQLTLVGGAAGLDREITWAHASDLPEPWDYLGPGELLLTNGTGIGSSPDAQVHFAERLARIGASGLVVGLGTGGAPVTPELAERVGELELPLLTAPYSTRFSDIARAVAEANDENGSEQFGDVAQFYDLLRLSLAAGDLGPATFDSLGSRLGLRLHLVDAETGASVFDDQATVRLGHLLARSVAEHGHAIPGLLRLSRDGTADGEVVALAVAVPGDPLTALIVEPLGGRLPTVAVLQHVAIAGAVQLAQIVSQRQRDRRQGAELLAQLLDPHRSWRVASAQPGAVGPDLAGSVLMVLRVTEPGAEDAMHRACARSHIASLLLRRDDLLYAIVPETAVAGLAPQAARQPGQPGSRVGVSDVVGSANRTPDAAQEALWALGIAEANAIPMVRYGDGARLLMPRSPAEAQALVDQVLGELLAYDRAHGSHYVDTVRAFVRADGSWQRAAAEMHVHKQTLGYRLRKVEELTGRGFASTQHLAEWWFALQALDLLAACSRPWVRLSRREPAGVDPAATEGVDPLPAPRDVEQLEVADPPRQRRVDQQVAVVRLEPERGPQQEQRRAG
jgi:PucR family transcriptional regulator, purine catabolism regulatory protein